jgi:MFS family permease
MVKRTPFSHGWVIVIVFLVSGIALYGVRFSYGVFFKSLEIEFGLSRAATSSIFSVNLLLSGVSAFFMGWALDRYGPKVTLSLMGLFTGLGLITTGFTNSLWQLYITYSLLLALGIGAIFVVPMSTISRWFDKKRGLAAGIASLGIGLGPLIMAPFATYIIINYTWRIASIIIGLVAFFVVLPISRLLKKSPAEVGALSDGVTASSNGTQNDHPPQTGLTLREALRTRSFYIILLIYLFFSSNIFFITTHLVPHVTDTGFSAMEAATMLSVVGVAAIVGRVLMGIVSDRIGRRFAVIVCALVQGVAVLWLIWAHDFWMLQLFAISFGLAYSGMSPSLAALISDTFGVGRIGTILGVLEVGFGLGAAAGPAIGGYIFDISGSYSAAFLLWTVAMLTAAVISFFVRQEHQIVSKLL